MEMQRIRESRICGGNRGIRLAAEGFCMFGKLGVCKGNRWFWLEEEGFLRFGWLVYWGWVGGEFGVRMGGSVG